MLFTFIAIRKVMLLAKAFAVQNCKLICSVQYGDLKNNRN